MISTTWGPSLNSNLNIFGACFRNELIQLTSWLKILIVDDLTRRRVDCRRVDCWRVGCRRVDHRRVDFRRVDYRRFDMVSFQLFWAKDQFLFRPRDWFQVLQFYTKFEIPSRLSAGLSDFRKNQLCANGCAKKVTANRSTAVDVVDDISSSTVSNELSFGNLSGSISNISLKSEAAWGCSFADITLWSGLRSCRSRNFNSEAVSCDRLLHPWRLTPVAAT